MDLSIGSMHHCRQPLVPVLTSTVHQAALSKLRGKHGETSGQGHRGAFSTTLARLLLGNSRATLVYKGMVNV